MGTPDDVFPEAATYLRIYFIGVTGLLFYNMGAGILRAVGDSRRPLYFLIFCAVYPVHYSARSWSKEFFSVQVSIRLLHLEAHGKQ